MANFRDIATSLGGSVGRQQQQGDASRQQLLQAIVPGLIKAQLDSKLKGQNQMNLLKTLKEMNLDGGKFEVSLSGDKLNIKPFSPAEQVKNIEARGTLSQAQNLLTGGGQQSNQQLPLQSTVQPNAQLSTQQPNVPQPTNIGEALLQISRQKQIEKQNLLEARQGRLIQKRTDVIEQRNRKIEMRKLQKEKEDIGGQINIISQDIESLFRTFKKIPAVNRGPIQGRTIGPVVGRFFQKSPEAAEYEDARQFFLSNISRKLGGERGVLTDRDIERVDTMFPQLRDTDVVANNKMVRIKDFIKRRVQENSQRLAGQIKRVQQSGSSTPISQREVPLQIFGFEQVGE